jgi:hypothetical protein
MEAEIGRRAMVLIDTSLRKERERDYLDCLNGRWGVGHSTKRCRLLPSDAPPYGSSPPPCYEYSCIALFGQFNRVFGVLPFSCASDDPIRCPIRCTIRCPLAGAMSGCQFPDSVRRSLIAG